MVVVPANPNNDDALLATDLHVQATYRLTEALVESENRMRRRIELLSEIVFETDAGGKLVFLNSAWSKVLGHPLEECIGRCLSLFVVGEDWPVFERIMKGWVPSPPVGRPRIRLLRADGGTAWAEISAARLADGGVVGALHDVTAEKSAQDEIAKLSLVASYTDNLVIITDRNGQTEWVNHAFTRRTGYTLADMVGRKPGEVLQGPDTDLEAVARVHSCLAEGQSFKSELLNYTRWGEPYWVSFQISPIRDAQGQVERFVSIQTDSTELHRAYGELEGAKKRAELMAVQAQAASQAKSEFLATMSHEIRTPMNGILGMAELLQKSRLDPHQRELAESIYGSSLEFLRIINDILDLSNIEAGRMELVTTDFDLRPLIEGVVALVAQSGSGKPVAMEAECDAAIPARLQGDADRLRQVLLNLIGNGLKFTASGSVVTRVRALESESDKVRLRFEIADTGTGIPLNKRGLLFQPFQQLDSSAARRHGGTGLGLAITRRLVEMMGGRMGMESEEGKGSTFWFELSLPMVQAAREVSLAGLRVLLAQDHAIHRRLSLLSLAKLGCQADAAGTGQEVLERLQAAKYDVGLLDLRLADKDGSGLATAIRDLEQARNEPGRRPIHLIALVAAEHSEDPKTLLARGINATLRTPFTQAALQQALRTVSVISHP